MKRGKKIHRSRALSVKKFHGLQVESPVAFCVRVNPISCGSQKLIVLFHRRVTHTEAHPAEKRWSVCAQLKTLFSFSYSYSFTTHKMLDKEELVLVRLSLFLSPDDVLYPLICGYFPFTILAASSSRPQSQSQSEDYPLQSFSQPREKEENGPTAGERKKKILKIGNCIGYIRSLYYYYDSVSLFR